MRFEPFLQACCFVVIAAYWAPAARAGDTRYSLADLEALDKDASWAELLSHASDIPPAQRTDKWNALVEHAALGVLASHAGEADVAWTFADEAVHQYPQLKKSKKYMAARVEADVHGLDACLRQPGPIVHGQPTRADPTPCADRAVTSAELDPGDPDTAFKLAARIAQDIPAASVRVYKRALAARHTAKDCAQKELGSAVADALTLSPEDARVADAQSIGFDLCWDGLKEAIVDRFIAETGSKSFRKNTCSLLLRKKDALSPLSTRQCEALIKEMTK